MDRFLAILSVALAVASLVPALAGKETRARIAGIVIALVLIGSAGSLAYSILTERREIDLVKGKLVSIFYANNPMTAEQAFNLLNRRDFATVTTAIYELEDESLIFSRPVEAVSSSGAKYVVRVYNSVNFSIP